MTLHAIEPSPPLGTDTPWAALPRPRWTSRVAKRLADIIGAGLALVVLSPVLALAAAAVRLSSPGPVIFRQERVGRDEVPFVMFKLRTMYVDNDDSKHRAFCIQLLTDADAPSADGAGTFKLTDDPRITPVGRVLRRFSIDELPQLVNVLRGEMSLVGPRPALDWEVALYSRHHHKRAAVRPGCTGLWQTSGRSTLTTLEMLDLDVEYARHPTLARDLAILAQTPAVLIRGDGAH